MVIPDPEQRPDYVLVGPPGTGPCVAGRALVSQHGFSARYDLDRENGLFSRKAHDLYGKSFVDQILVFPMAKGGIATSWMLHEMASRSMAPLGLIFHTTNPVMVQGAVLAGLPLMHCLVPEPHKIISTADWVELNPTEGTVRGWKAQHNDGQL